MKSLRSFLLSASVLCLFAVTGFSQGRSFNEPPDGIWHIQSVMAGDQNIGFWDQPGYPTVYKKGDGISMYTGERKPDQSFIFNKAPETGWYYINPTIGGAIDVSQKNARKNGVQITVWEINKQANQKFCFVHLGDGRWKIYTPENKVLTASGRSVVNGTKVVIWDDHDGPWTEWFLVNDKGERYVATPFLKVEPESLQQEGAQRQAYFTRVNEKQWNKEQFKFLHWMNSLSLSEQYPILEEVIRYAKQNKNIFAKRAILNSLSSTLAIKKPAAPAEQILAAKTRAEISRAMDSDTDELSKRYMDAILKKLQ